MRKNKFNRIAHQRGYLVVVAVILIMIIGFMGAVVANMFFSSSQSTASTALSDNALYLAESGLEYVAHRVVNPTFANQVACSAAALADQPLGSGTFTVTTSLNPGVTTLNGALTNVAVSMNVFTTVNFPTAGQVAIDQELINYTGTTATTITGLTRGAGGSTAAAHTNGATVQAVLTTASAIASNATTLTVASTAIYPESGRIMLDDELIDYTDTTATTFTGLTRGVAGTTAAAHVAGTEVGQYQCNANSIGGVPSVASPNAERTVNQAVSLQDGWAVGQASGGQYVMIEWNKPAGHAWTNRSFTSAANANLLAVTMTSYADGWAVGAANGGNPTILHWDGSRWTRVLPAVAVNAGLNNISCISTPDCWAVGINVGGNTLIERWNGATWARVTPTVAVNVALNSVSCVSTSDCWAVGANNAGNPLIERWNGATWARVTPTVAVNAALNSVTCNSTSDCWAVGNVQGGNDFIEHWNGANWSRNASAPATPQNLFDVDCMAANDCWAVGAAGHIIHYDGTSWTTFTTPTAIQLNNVGLINNPPPHPSGWREVFS